MKDDTVIIIPSCDKYSDLWHTFFFFFHKYWQDCPYPIYLMTNNLSYEDQRIITLKIGEDVSWSANLKKALGTVRNRTYPDLVGGLFLNGECEWITNRSI